jgi:hypothetical protein
VVTVHLCCCCTATRRPISCGMRITAAAAFDVVPTGGVWARADAQLALV